jgi:flavin-binding protein dodecin
MSANSSLSCALAGDAPQCPVSAIPENAATRRNMTMKAPDYKLIELTATSTTSLEDAMIAAVQRAHASIKNLCWFEVGESRDKIDSEGDGIWQATVRVGFTV